MTRAFIFPGQASQQVGMGQALAEASPVARQVFEEVDDTLNQHLTKIMFEGPEDDLTLTENAQPAIMAVSVAVYRVLEKEAGLNVSEAANFIAGHSLGEYAALAVAGTFSLAEAATLLKTRGQAMQKAVPVGEGAMAALLGLDLDDAIAVAEEAGEVCTVANDNAPGQVVVSGSKEAVERAVELAAGRGAKRSILLPVSAPFHCPLMAPAADVMAEALASVNMNAPVVPLVANVTASPVQSPDEIRNLLVEQVTERVRWREGVLKMKEDGVDTMVEIGAGKVLSGMTKRIDRDIKSLNVGTPDDVEAFIKTL
ncbi:MAG: ACP S-malonyltransferase [Rhodospirillaceae bacterium]|jgi:[acyl-carrier-protein] S-malonyltransferase